MMSRTLKAYLAIAICFTIAGIILLTSIPAKFASGDEMPESTSKQLERIQQRCDALEKRFGESMELISRLSRISPPIGTVVAYAGVWPPPKGEGGTWTEDELGWMLCDGRTISGTSFAELLKVLGRNNLPDYRGCFLRGVDVAADGVSTSKRDIDGIRTVGSVQNWSTGYPKNAFTTSPAGDFDPRSTGGDTPGANPEFRGAVFDRLLTADGKYQLAGNGGSAPGGFGGLFLPDLHDSRPIKLIPPHTHTILGGDPETRPVNVTVYWIIKSK